MKSIRNILAWSISTLGATMAMFFILYASYRQTAGECTGELHRSFQEVIQLDLQHRFDRTKVFFSYGPSPDTLPSDKITIKKEGELKIKDKPDRIKQMSDLEKIHHMQQSYLREENPVNVYVLDSIWHAELLKHGISARTAVRYTDQAAGKTYMSNPDSGFYALALHTPTITLGIEEEIELQGFARLVFFATIRNNIKEHAPTLVLWIVCIGFISVFSFRRKREIPAPIPADVAISVPDQVSRYHITEYMYLDMDKHLLIRHGEEIVLTKLLTQLLELLWTGTDHYASYQALIDPLYGNIPVDNGKERLTQAVKRLEKRLEDVPELEIENIPTKGYRIMLHS